MEFPATGQSPQVTSQFSITSPDQFPHMYHPKSPTKLAKSNTPSQDDKKTKDVKSAINNAEENNPKVKYSDLLKEEEVEKMNIMENLQLAVVGKFSYGWPELEELRIQIPKQCGIKGDCRIGLLRNRHILIRLNRMEDFVNIMAKNESLFSIPADVGKPIHLDKATINKTRPSCARLKVQVDLATELPRQVEIEVVDNNHNMKNKENHNADEKEPGEDKQKKDQPEAAKGIHLNNNFSSLQEQRKEGTMIYREEFSGGASIGVNGGKGEQVPVEIMVKSEFIDEVVNDVEDVMSDTLIALAAIVERSLPMGTENEQQRQELTLPLANANGDKKQESMKKVEDREEDANHGIEMKVHQEADLSPQSSTKNNKSRNKEEKKPTKVNPKRKDRRLPVTSNEVEDFAFYVNSCELLDINFKGAHSPGGMAELIRGNCERLKEELFEEHPTISNRLVLQKAQAELRRYLQFEQEFWTQYAGIQWFSEGDRKTRFFHSLVKGMRKRLSLSRIIKEDGQWAKGNKQVAAEVVSFFQKQFTCENDLADMFLLNHVPTLVTKEMNRVLLRNQSRRK
ncbi:hypothetical protein H5410_056321 [Solanum commersonii]|uniref:DUF4283 domain-containing protein n=1 Tax=Solanum commersonii TaxID=4109 RepID=A0A9J5WJY7_SOLCO|nr:hypothetical protein H5410_056321 [Solanum commersonii]